MLITALIAGAMVGAPQDQEVSLLRVNKPGEKTTYEVKSHLLVESKQLGLNTWLPETLDFNYKFTTEVLTPKADGIVEMRYKRPTMTQIDGETFDTPAKTTVDKLNWEMILTLSPVNEIISMKDLTPKKKDPPKTGGGKWVVAPVGGGAPQLGAFIGPFLSEVYRLSLFIGSLDSALDFSPKLPIFESKPGATWKKTVGYQPQSLVSKDGKSVVQRLDYVYTYRGVMESNGVKVHRVDAELDLKTDLAKFLHDNTGLQASDTGLKSIDLNLKAKIEFDLDLNTRKTLRANANSEGGFAIFLTQRPNAAVQEERLKGRTTLRLVQ